MVGGIYKEIKILFYKKSYELYFRIVIAKKIIILSRKWTKLVTVQLFLNINI